MPPVRNYSVPSRPQAVDAAVADDDEIMRPLALVPAEAEASAGDAGASAVGDSAEGSAREVVAPSPAAEGAIEVVLADVATTTAGELETSMVTGELAAIAEPSDKVVSTGDSVMVDGSLAAAEAQAATPEVASETAATQDDSVGAREAAETSTSTAKLVEEPVAAAEVVSEAKSEVKSEAAAEVKSEAAAEVKSEAAAEVKSEAAAEVKSEAAAEVKSEAVAEAAAEVKSEAAAEVKSEAAAEVKPAAPAEKSRGARRSKLAAEVKSEVAAAVKSAVAEVTDPAVTSVLVTPVATKVTRGVAKIVHTPTPEPVVEAAESTSAGKAAAAADSTAADSTSSGARKKPTLPPVPAPSGPVPVFRPPGSARTTPTSMPAVGYEGSPAGDATEEVVEDAELTREVYAEMLTLATVSRTRPPPPPSRSTTPTPSASSSVLSSLAIEDEEEMTHVVYTRQRIPRSPSSPSPAAAAADEETTRQVDLADMQKAAKADAPTTDETRSVRTDDLQAESRTDAAKPADPPQDGDAKLRVDERAEPASAEAVKQAEVAEADASRSITPADLIAASSSGEPSGPPLRDRGDEVTRVIRRQRPPADDETPTLLFAPSSAEILLPVAEKPAPERPANSAAQAAMSDVSLAISVIQKPQTGAETDEMSPAKRAWVDAAATVSQTASASEKPAASETAVEASEGSFAEPAPASTASAVVGEKPAETGAVASEKPAETVAATGEKPAEAVAASGVKSAASEKPAEAVAASGVKSSATSPTAASEKSIETGPASAARPESSTPGTWMRTGEASEVDDADDPLLGLVIDDRYRLERVLGSGGMSRVYQAAHVRSGGKVAIKIIELHLSHRPDTMKRCEQEARAMMEIQSNHVVRAYDVGTFPTGQLYVVMELLNGETLEHMIKRDGPIPWTRVAQMALQICSGLTAGHRRGIFHRDVKPQNCMRIDLDDNVDHVKLIDFGLARDINSVESGVTQEGVILGTPEYMAPELIASRATPDARSDVYALGATMYKLLTGSAVFHEKNALDTLFQHKHTQPRAPSQVAPEKEISEAMDAIVLKALAKDPGQRFVSVEEMAQHLRQALGVAEPSNRHRAARERSQPIVAAGIVNADAMPAASVPASKRPVTGPSVVVQRRVPTTPAPLPVPAPPPVISVPPPPVAERPFPWGRTAVVLLGLALVAIYFWPPPGAPEVPTKIAKVGPRAPGSATPVRSPKIPPREIKAPPAPVVTPVADPPPVEDPPPVDVPPTVVQPDPVPEPVTPTAVAPSKPESLAFNFRSARALIAEQHDFLRQTCMKKGKEPVRVLKFSIAVKPNGRSTVFVDGEPAVRSCVKSVLGFSFPPSPDGAAFDYTLWLADSRLDKRTH